MYFAILLTMVSLHEEINLKRPWIRCRDSNLDPRRVEALSPKLPSFQLPSTPNSSPKMCILSTEFNDFNTFHTFLLSLENYGCCFINLLGLSHLNHCLEFPFT